MANFVDLTTWIPVDDAKKMIAELIEQGKYQKHQIKKSSNLFANRKDKSDGYICRVLAEAGICPELEIVKEKKKATVKKQKEVATVANTELVDNRRYVVQGEPINESEGLFLIDQGGKFWLEKHNVKNNNKEKISIVVDTESDARMLWNDTLLKIKRAS